MSTSSIGDTDISVLVTQRDLIASIIRSVEETYLPANRNEAIVDFVMSLLEEYSPIDDTADSLVAKNILELRARNKRFICHNCGSLDYEDNLIVSFLSNLDAVCPHCNSSEVETL